MTLSTAPDHFIVYDLVIKHVAFTTLPISNSYTLLVFGLLRTNTGVLVLPHATISIIRVIWRPINRATGDFSPAVLRADKTPYECVIDFTAYQDVVWGVTEVARFAIS